MNKKNILLLLSSSCLLLSCGKGGEKEDKPVKEAKIHASLEARMEPEDEKRKDYDLVFDYKDDFFLKDAKEFDSDLCMLSFGMAMAGSFKKSSSVAYKAMGFKNVYHSNGFEERKEDGIAYSFAHKVIEDKELVSISIRGLDYGIEWSDNLNLGLTGNHAGFEARATEILNQLKVYTKEIPTYRLWISGYSRGGGIANVLSRMISVDESVNVDASEIFVYTFNAPNCLAEENAEAYENVHNIINSADLVSAIPPTEFGFDRCGNSIDIYSADIDKLLHEFDEKIVFPEFKSLKDEGEAQEGEVFDDRTNLKYVIDGLLNGEDGDDPELRLNSRENYYNSYQKDIQYALGLFFGLKQETIDKIKNGFSSLSPWEMLGLLGDDGFYNFLNPYIKEDGIAYQEEELKATCAKALDLLKHNVVLLQVAMGESILPRMIDMHYPETTYVLLKNYLTSLSE